MTFKIHLKFKTAATYCKIQPKAILVESQVNNVLEMNSHLIAFTT